MKIVLLFAGLVLQSQLAFAVTCEINCTIRYNEVLDSIDGVGSTQTQLRDFREVCQQYYKGYYTYGWDPERPTHYLCTKHVSVATIEIGYGGDPMTARESARQSCRQRMPSASAYVVHPRAGFGPIKCAP